MDTERTGVGDPQIRKVTTGLANPAGSKKITMHLKLTVMAHLQRRYVH
jgi:hypothetical protein